MRLALCGLPSAGKSTLFAALAGRRTASGGRAEANLALLNVPDERVDRLSALYRPKKTTYAQISFVDPPPPPAKPEDPAARLPVELGQCEGLVQVVRNFDAGLGAPNPAADFRAFVEEMLLHDLIIVERRLERIASERQRGREVSAEEVALLERAQAMLGEEKLLIADPEIPGHPRLRGFGLLTAKPRVVVANNVEDDPAPPELGGERPPVVVRAAIEAELAELGEEERAEFMAELGIAESALDRLITAAYRACRLISFFTVGEDEVRAWTITQGTLAQQAAGVIHSDLEKGFIRAEVMSYADLIAQGSEAAVKKAGLLKLVGKDYPVSDGEVMHVRFNV
ncbi:MAG: redox-regulated ATPase YchF [Desulfarculus sp.]|nr:MAG: redox-regulated ATPase YchF [Desulfarculus sp.]